MPPATSSGSDWSGARSDSGPWPGINSAGTKVPLSERDGLVDHADDRARLRMRLPLHRAGEGGDVMLDEKRVDEGDRDRAQEGAGHERAPVEDIAADKLGEDADRDRLL